MAWLATERDIHLDGPDELWRWSVDQLEDFWAAIFDCFQVISPTPYEQVLVRRVMPGATWFPGATLNYAEHVFRNATPDRPAFVAVDETHVPRDWSWADLERDVAALAATLRAAGVMRGDRICGYLPNIAEALLALLATTSIGAVWSVCAPDFGLTGAVDRFRQLAPKVLIGVDGYRFGGRDHSRRAELAALRSALDSVVLTIRIPGSGKTAAVPGVIDWSEAVSVPGELSFEHVPFDHPLWVLFSSGTTGLPKGIVHGHGGIVLEHLKATALGLDLRRGDRFYCYSSTSWMVWNSSIGTMLHGCIPILYNGSPSHPDVLGNWRVAAATGAQAFGTGAAYLTACGKAGARPTDQLDLSRLRLVVSTGSTLPKSAWRWVHDVLGDRVRLDSSSGGTGVCSGFVGGNALKPETVGELAGPYLGVRAEAWDAAGRAVTEELGELVITEPMPSMPIRFWDDEDGSRYRDSYFTTYPGVWRHGDWVRVTGRGPLVIAGRSDSTLNKAGVRMGSSDIYAVVDRLPGVADSLVVGVELPDGEYFMPLFVVPARGRNLDDGLLEEIVSAVRTQLSPRHVPDEVITAPAVPRTLTGKKHEVPVKRILGGASIQDAVNAGSVDRPEMLAWYAELARQRRLDRRTPPVHV